MRVGLGLHGVSLGAFAEYSGPRPGRMAIRVANSSYMVPHFYPLRRACMYLQHHRCMAVVFPGLGGWGVYPAAIGARTNSPRGSMISPAYSEATSSSPAEMSYSA